MKKSKSVRPCLQIFCAPVHMIPFLSLPGQAGGSISEGLVYWRVRGCLEEHNGFAEDEPGEAGKQVCVTDLPTVCISRRSGNTVVTPGLPAIHCTISAAAYGCIFTSYTYSTFIALQFDFHWDSSASYKILTCINGPSASLGVRSAYQHVMCLDLSAIGQILGSIGVRSGNFPPLKSLHLCDEQQQIQALLILNCHCDVISFNHRWT